MPTNINIDTASPTSSVVWSKWVGASQETTWKNVRQRRKAMRQMAAGISTQAGVFLVTQTSLKARNAASKLQ